MTATQAEFTFDDIIGNSNVMVKAKKLGRIASRSNANVLLLEKVVQVRNCLLSLYITMVTLNPFIAINCGSLPRNLIESELLVMRGAFTGKEGVARKFELANGGTIFLDEIGICL